MDSVKAQFQVLFVDSPAQLDALLTLTLAEYQSRAGIVESFEVSEDENAAGGVTVPADFLGVVTATDSTSMWHEHRLKSGVLSIITDNYSKAPFDVLYHVNLSKVDQETYELPSGGIQLLHRYLKTLIEIPNNIRAKHVNDAAGLPSDYLMGEADLREQLKAISEEMKTNNSFMPSMMVV